MWRWAIVAVIGLAVIVIGFSLADVATSGDVDASAVLSGTVDTSGFARAYQARDWQFPRDFAAHDEFQTEWWYYTGNLTTDDGRHFGYQFTIFRRALTPGGAVNADQSEWRTNQVYMAHFAVTDVAEERFFHEERFARASADLAGATLEPSYRVWLEDWAISGTNDAATERRIRARMTDGAEIDFALQIAAPPALHGANTDGLSAKSAEPGNASYYYSLTRMPTNGTITIGDQVFRVAGNTWMDHEFSTSALGTNALGWDWFGLQFDDGRDMMIGQIRLTDGGKDPYFGGLLVNADGSTQYLPSDAITITPLAVWTSPHTGSVYPSGWTISVTPESGDAFTFTATPQILDQELYGGDIAYWEGTVRLDGDVTGYGYAELTGYVDALTGRF
jgi:predicted secreted hydrolase